MSESNPTLPAPVQRLLGDIRIDQTNIAEIDHVLPGLEEEITKALAVLEDLKGRHTALGRARTERMENIRVSREMITGWCQAHQMPVPAEEPPALPAVTCTCELHEQHTMCSSLTGCPCIEAPVAPREDPTETQALKLADLPTPPKPALDGGGPAAEGGPFHPGGGDGRG